MASKRVADVMATVDRFTEEELKDVEYVPIRVTANILLYIGAGIYHSVAGAIKELVNNSYDASATQVSINTDYPNYKEIRVVDNGVGMSADRFIHAMSTIGSSLKGVVDRRRTTKYFNRPIIGRLGIGLMSLSQVCSKAVIESQEENSDSKFIAILDFSQFKDRAEIKDREHQVFEDQYGGVEGMQILLKSPKTKPDVKQNIRRILELLDQLPADRNAPDNAEYLGYCVLHRNLPAIKGQQGTTITLQDIDETVIDSLRDTGKSENLLSRFKSKPLSWEEHCEEVNGWTWEELCERLQLEVNNLSYHLLPKYHQFLWELSLMTPISYLPRGPITIKPTILQEKKKGLKDFNFNLRVDNRLLYKPILLPSGLLARQGSDLRESFDYNIETFKFDKKVDKEPLKYKGYIYWQRNQVHPVPLRGIQIYIRNVGIGTYDYTLLQFPTVSLASRAGQVSGEIYVEQGLERALNIDRNGFRQTDEHYVALQQHVWNILGSATRGDGIFGRSVDAYDLRKDHIEKEVKKEHVSELKKLVENFSDGKYSLTFSNAKNDKPYVISKNEVVIYDQSSRWPKSRQERFICQRLLIPTLIAIESGESPSRLREILEIIALR